MSDNESIDHRASIASYIEQRAQQHRSIADRGGKDASYHKGTAILYDAMVSDIRAGLDLP